jgi:predicted ABC-type ATPase
LAKPRMIVIGGPPGAGKTSRCPASAFGVDSFNADSRATELNGGNSRGISKEIRAQVNVEFQKWIIDHISTGRSFAFETTLRSAITFEQAKLARSHGFRTRLYYITAGTVEESIRRIKERAWSGGHSAPESLLRDIYQKSTQNLIRALNFRKSAIQTVRIYDNSARFAPDKLLVHIPEIMTVRQGQIRNLTDPVPAWLKNSLKGTQYDLSRARDEITANPEIRDPGPER